MPLWAVRQATYRECLLERETKEEAMEACMDYCENDSVGSECRAVDDFPVYTVEQVWNGEEENE